MLRVGVIGCGQLARMLALEAARMGIQCVFVAIGDEDVAAVQPLAHTAVLRFYPGNEQRIADALGECAVVTSERENLPVALLDLAEYASTLRPGRAALQAFSRRDSERDTLTALGMPVSPFAIVNEPGSLSSAADAIGFPVVIKTVCGGYDGKGQWRASDAAQLQALDIGNRAYPLLVERQIAFTRELAITAVRAVNGEILFYPLTQNRHANGILISACAPAQCDPHIERTARRWTAQLMESLDYTGVLTIELFDTPEGLLVNEIAPRVHNSAHWTLGGAMTSQFENHLRAITGAMPGATAALGHCGIVNVLGKKPPVNPGWLRENTHLHDYAKAERAGRKLGHVLVRDSHTGMMMQQIQELEALVALNQ